MPRTLKRPTNRTEARAIAKRGDAAIPALRAAPRMTVRSATNSIFALGLIGSPAAMEALKGYSGDERITILYALLGAAAAFDPIRYSAEVLGRRSIVQLRLTRQTARPDLRVLAALRDLQHLSISEYPDLNDLSALAPLTSLRTLKLSITEDLTSLAGIEGLGQLEELWAKSSDVLEDISAIRGLTALRRLGVPCPAMTDLRFFSEMTRLEGLSTGGPDLVRLDGLEAMRALDWLSLSWARRLTDLRAISGLPRLRSLTTLLAPLRAFPELSLPALTELQLCGSEALTDLSALLAIPSLQQLELRNLPALTTLDSLAGHPGLRHITLWDCDNLTDISALAALPALTTLHCIQCAGLTELSALAGCAALSHLQIAGIRGIRSLAFLRTLPALQQLTFERNPDAADLAVLAGLSGVRVYQS